MKKSIIPDFYRQRIQKLLVLFQDLKLLTTQFQSLLNYLGIQEYYLDTSKLFGIPIYLQKQEKSIEFLKYKKLKYGLILKITFFVNVSIFLFEL